MSIVIVHTIDTDTKTGNKYKSKYVIEGRMEDAPEFVEFLNSVINQNGITAELEYVEHEFLLDSWRGWRKIS